MKRLNIINSENAVNIFSLLYINIQNKDIIKVKVDKEIAKKIIEVNEGIKSYVRN